MKIDTISLCATGAWYSHNAGKCNHLLSQRSLASLIFQAVLSLLILSRLSILRVLKHQLLYEELHEVLRQRLSAQYEILYQKCNLILHTYVSRIDLLSIHRPENEPSMSWRDHVIESAHKSSLHVQ